MSHLTICEILGSNYVLNSQLGQALNAVICRDLVCSIVSMANVQPDPHSDPIPPPKIRLLALWSSKEDPHTHCVDTPRPVGVIDPATYYSPDKPHQLLDLIVWTNTNYSSYMVCRYVMDTHSLQKGIILLSDAVGFTFEMLDADINSRERICHTDTWKGVKVSDTVAVNKTTDMYVIYDSSIRFIRAYSSPGPLSSAASGVFTPDEVEKNDTEPKYKHVLSDEGTYFVIINNLTIEKIISTFYTKLDDLLTSSSLNWSAMNFVRTISVSDDCKLSLGITKSKRRNLRDVDYLMQKNVYMKINMHKARHNLINLSLVEYTAPAPIIWCGIKLLFSRNPEIKVRLNNELKYEITSSFFKAWALR